DFLAHVAGVLSGPLAQALFLEAQSAAVGEGGDAVGDGEDLVDGGAVVGERQSQAQIDLRLSVLADEDAIKARLPGLEDLGEMLVQHVRIEVGPHLVGGASREVLAVAVGDDRAVDAIAEAERLALDVEEAHETERPREVERIDVAASRQQSAAAA